MEPTPAAKPTPDADAKKLSADSSKWTPSQRNAHAVALHDAYETAYANPDWAAMTDEGKPGPYYRLPTERQYCVSNGSMNGKCGCPHCTGQRAASQVQADATGYDWKSELE